MDGAQSPAPLAGGTFGLGGNRRRQRQKRQDREMELHAPLSFLGRLAHLAAGRDVACTPPATAGSMAARSAR
jgi:hypothetical protein